jgi:hypothetical protein
MFSQESFTITAKIGTLALQALKREVNRGATQLTIEEQEIADMLLEQLQTVALHSASIISSIASPDAQADLLLANTGLRGITDIVNAQINKDN